jgi:hypothetical protein
VLDTTTLSSRAVAAEVLTWCREVLAGRVTPTRVSSCE